MRKRNIQPRSRDRCCRTTHSECLYINYQLDALTIIYS